MSTNRISPQPLLDQDECAAIDEFAQTCDNRKDTGLADLADFLRRRFSLELVLDPDIVAGFIQDSSNLPGEALGVCRPCTELECAIILRACQAVQIPCTVAAGRSNLTGSATPAGGIIISLLNLLTPEVEVELEAHTVTSPVGMILEEMREAVLQQTSGKLIFPVDPTSRADACMGGVIACNASGFTPGASGAVRDWVKSISFILPDGSKIIASRGQYVSAGGKFILHGSEGEREMPVATYPRPEIKNAGGPFSAPHGSMDFIDLVVGSEGIFGLVTACVLGLKDAPKEYLDLFFSLPTEAEALKLHYYLHDKLGSFDSLTAFEYFGPGCRKYMNHEGVLFAGDNQVGINIQVPIHDRGLEDEAETWLELLDEADCGIDEDAIILLDNQRARKTFMEARHSLPANALEKVQRRGTITIMTDTVVPQDKFGEFLGFTHNLINQHSLDYLAFGHFGDCHLHFTILPQKDELALGLELYDLIVNESARLGGVYSGEHGTGKRKRKDFLACYGPEAAREVMRCKMAVDPKLLLNRGNVFDPDEIGAPA